jgi:pilus assembly protein CpaE
MLRVLIATAPHQSSHGLRAQLEQTGLVEEVREWLVSSDKVPEASEALADVVLLDLGRDPDPFFSLARYIRGLHPAVRIVACSAEAEPEPQLLLEAMRSGVQEFLSKPVDPAALRAILERFLTELATPGQQASHRLILVMGAKGGVGTTTIAVNLAVQVAEKVRRRVLLVDLARPLGQAHLMLNLTPRFTVRDAVENLHRLDSHFFAGLLLEHRSGLYLLGGVGQPEEWERLPVNAIERVLNVARSGFEVVVVDCGTQFSTDWASIYRSAGSVVLVAETTVPALWALERHLLALLGLGLQADQVRIVINRWRRSDDEALKTVEKNIKHPIYSTIPNDFRQVSEAINMGLPLSGNHNNPLVSKYALLAAQLTGAEPAEPARPRTGGLNLFLFPKR